VANGIFIALEGIDGSGTTTQAERLVAHLEARGRAAVRTAEPSGGPVGRLIRSALTDRSLIGDETLGVLFAADRLDHLEREVLPALERGLVVVSDRYLLSSLAYQGSYLPVDFVLALNERARRPDASILLRVSPETAAGRRHHRGGPTERFDDLERQRQIAWRYDEAFARRDVGPTAIIDAEAGLDDVERELAAVVEGFLGPLE
jgi:dTMP kinase